MNAIRHDVLSTTAHRESSEEAVAVRGLTKAFRSRTDEVLAVRHVDMSVRRGEVMALLGPNGAGKTTLLDMVLGMSTPDTGEVRVLGRPPRTAVSHGLVGAVQQTGGLLGNLSVHEAVTMIASLYPHHMPVGEALERSGAASYAKRRISTCSGGQQQRVKFALALLPEPDLLVLDEPTAGMDPQSRTAFWDTMHAEAREGRTVVFATHYLQEAEDFAQRIVLMKDGRVAHDGTLAEFRSASQHHTVSFTWPHDAPAPQLPDVTSVNRSGTRYTVHTQDADVLARHLLTETSASELEVSRGGLDQAFAELTGPSETADTASATNAHGPATH